MMVYLRLRLLPRKVRDTGSYYFEGCHRQRVRSGPEDLMSKRQLQAAVRRQIG
jgi:hypothetical protein